MKEYELTEYVRKDFEAIGYTTYAEVCSNGGGSARCDMYGVIEDKNNERYGHSVAFEAKLTFNLKVLQQAYFWTGRANNVIIIIPVTYKDMATRKFARVVCQKFGIGVIEVDMKRGKYYMTVKPVHFNNPKKPKLYEEQKSIIASNSENKFVTPFKITVKNIDEYMKDKDSEYLITLIKNIKHHYKGEISAVRSISLLIQRGVINNYKLIKENNKLKLYKN